MGRHESAVVDIKIFPGIDTVGRVDQASAFDQKSHGQRLPPAGSAEPPMMSAMTAMRTAMP